MKVYYEEAGWNEITGKVIGTPIPDKKTNGIGSYIIEIIDFEGALFAAWEAKDFTKMKVTDDDGNNIFVGYLQTKTFTSSSLRFVIVGFGKKLEWLPFDQNFIKATGLVKTTPYTTIGDYLSINLANTPQYMCTDGLNYYVTNSAKRVYKYTKSCAFVASYDLSGDIAGTMTGICFDGTYFYCLDYTNSLVYVCNTAFVVQHTHAVVAGALDIAFDGFYFYVTEANNNRLYKYDADFVYVEYNSIPDPATPKGVEIYNDMIYILSVEAGPIIKVFIYDSDYVLDDTITISESTACQGICWNEKHFLIVSENNRLYLYGDDYTNFDQNYYVELMLDSEGALSWADQQWINNRNVGLSIQDNSNGNVTETYTVSGVTPNGETGTVGTFAGMNTIYDGILYRIYDDTTNTDAYVIAAVNGANIATAYDLKKITIKYRFSSGVALGGTLNVYLQINKDGVYETVAQLYTHNSGGYSYVDNWVEGEVEITEDLADYLHITGANYDALNGIKFLMDGLTSLRTTIDVDYLEVDIEYNIQQIAPIMNEILDSRSEVLLCATNFNTNGVQAGDKFQIGENTNEIIHSIESKSSLTIKVNSTLSKYMARNFKGNNCIEGLKSICLLEGLQWAEDHTNEQIILFRKADAEDSTITLDSTDYDDKWEYEDNCNHVKEIIVYGNASLNITYTAVNTSSTSLMSKQIVDDTIMTVADAEEVAETQLAIWKDKQPSIKVIITDEFLTLEAGQTVNLTMARPTVAAADYIVRRMTVQHIGYDSSANEIFRTVLYCGLGSTPIEEKLDNLLSLFEYSIHKGFTDRLINTPLGAGATISSSDIIDFNTAVQALSINNVVEDTTPEIAGDLNCGAYNILQPFCAIQKNSAQSIANNTPTLVVFNAGDNEISDSLSMHNPAVNPSRITIPASRGGVYLISAIWSWANNANGRRVLAIKVNGVTKYNNEVAVTLYSVNLAAFTFPLAAGDYVEMEVYQSSGGALANFNALGYNVFSVIRQGDNET